MEVLPKTATLNLNSEHVAKGASEYFYHLASLKGNAELL